MLIEKERSIVVRVDFKLCLGYNYFTEEALKTLKFEGSEEA